MAPLMPMHDSAAAFLTTIWRCTSSCTQMLQPYQSFLPCLHIAHCNHSCGYSTGIAESHVLIAIGIHVRLHCPIHYKLLLCFHSQCGAEYHTAFTVYPITQFTLSSIRAWDLPCSMWAEMSRLADYLLKLCNHTSMETYLHTCSIKANLILA